MTMLSAPLRTAALALLGTLTVGLAHAEAPMVTDDAGTLDKGGVKVELAWDRSGKVRGPSLALATAPIEHLEVELALASAHDHSTSPHTAAHANGLAVKWVPWSWGNTSAGLKFETSRAKASGAGSDRNVSIQGLLTHTYSGNLVLHANLGHERDTDGAGLHSDANTWALGGEVPLTESVKLVGDLYGDSHSQPGKQIGVRWTVKEGIKLSAALGRQAHESQVRTVFTWEF